MRHNPESAVSDTYKLNLDTLKNGQLEYFLALLKNINIAIGGT